ncbi:MAG: hypothetical protein K6G92_04915, partial [Bacteroidaceae bacterium]|nr:hypothetical protein [Bacteroidaceae bacterium]
MIDHIIEYNKTFVAQKGYEKFLTMKHSFNRYGLAVLFCLCGICSYAMVPDSPNASPKKTAIKRAKTNSNLQAAMENYLQDAQEKNLN